MFKQLLKRFFLNSLFLILVFIKFIIILYLINLFGWGPVLIVLGIAYITLSIIMKSYYSKGYGLYFWTPYFRSPNVGELDYLVKPQKTSGSERFNLLTVYLQGILAGMLLLIVGILLILYNYIYLR